MALFVYLLICVSQLVLRRRLEREDPERLEVRMWLYPYLTWFAIAAIGVVIASMAFVDDVRSQLWLGLLSVGVVLVAYFVKSRRQGSRGDAGDGAGATDASRGRAVRTASATRERFASSAPVARPGG